MKVTVPLPVKMVAGHEVVHMCLPVGTYHKLQGVIVVVEPTLQQDKIAVGQTLCNVEAGQVWV